MSTAGAQADVGHDAPPSNNADANREPASVRYEGAMNSVTALLMFRTFVDAGVQGVLDDPQFAHLSQPSAFASTTPAAPLATMAAPVPPAPAASHRWYVVVRGRQVGVFSSWHVAQQASIGVPGGAHRRFSTESTARSAFAQACQSGGVHRINTDVPEGSPGYLTVVRDIEDADTDADVLDIPYGHSSTAPLAQASTYGGQHVITLESSDDEQ